MNSPAAIALLVRDDPFVRPERGTRLGDHLKTPSPWRFPHSPLSLRRVRR
jgi:hypothetical protein